MDVKLVQTCGACPEQYDAFYDGKKVGYLRLRHGVFYAECPGVGGEEVYEAFPNGDGMFEAWERENYLDEAKEAIKHWVEKENANG